MKPKEKANELVMKHSFETHAHNAKRSATTTVDEIIEALENLDVDFGMDQLGAMQLEVDYWQDVKQEIESL